MKPKGTVLILGGSEDRGDDEKDMQRNNTEYE